jgi:hypothetical protein
LGKPNFSFQKRQKELAKKKKNEEKRQRKLDNNAVKPAEDQLQQTEGVEENKNSVWWGNKQRLSIKGRWENMAASRQGAKKEVKKPKSKKK